MKAKLSTLPFRAEHLDLLVMRELETGCLDPVRITSVAIEGSAVTVVIDGRILAICGIMQQWQGVLDVYVIPSIYVWVYRKSFHKYIKGMISNLIDTLPIHRLQTNSIADEQTDGWMKRLGFECEGTLRHYTSAKQDFRMWAKLIPREAA